MSAGKEDLSFDMFRVLGRKPKRDGCKYVRDE